MSKSKRPRKPDTTLAHAGREPARYYGFVNMPIYRGSTVLFPTLECLEANSQDYSYGRLGTPTVQALQSMIAELEGDRGFYAGATGWCDDRGDGRWVVSIRCAQLSADGRRARAYSGGGIVAESEVGEELAETSTKFATILSALGAAL